MSELIRHGIEQANVDLKKENEQKLVHQVRASHFQFISL